VDHSQKVGEEMTCKLHKNYIPHNGDPTDTYRFQGLPCPYCWQARCHWLHENRKLHIVAAQELREAAPHFTPPNKRIEFLEAQVQKLKKHLKKADEIEKHGSQLIKNLTVELLAANQFIFDLSKELGEKFKEANKEEAKRLATLLEEGD